MELWHETPIEGVLTRLQQLARFAGMQIIVQRALTCTWLVSTRQLDFTTYIYRVHS
jgi:hypothetical protein